MQHIYKEEVTKYFELSDNKINIKTHIMKLKQYLEER